MIASQKVEGVEPSAMRTLGLIGGMSWQSTALYYAGLNQGVSARMGGLHSAPLLIASMDFQRVVNHQLAGRWEEAGTELVSLARRLEDAGADAIALAVNTMHKVADPIRESINVPFLDIRSCMGHAIAATKGGRAVLLGTDYVVCEDYYIGEIERSLEGRLELTTLPNIEQRFVHNIIYDELSKGYVSEDTRQRIAGAIRQSIQLEGVGTVALACTELPMLRLAELLPDIPVVDSTSVHVEACLNFILGTTVEHGLSDSYIDQFCRNDS